MCVLRPQAKRMLQALSCAGALWGCSPRAFDDLPDLSRADAAATASDAGEADDAQSEPDVAPMTEEDAASEPEDAQAPDPPDPPDAGDASACLAPPGPGHAFKVSGTRELGPLPIPETAAQRTLASSTRLGDKILWTFHNASFQADPPVSYPSAAFSPAAAPLALADLTDPAGAPLRFLQHAAGEDAMAFALDPASVVATSEHAALAFFVRIYYVLGVSVGVAHVDEQGNTARQPEFLFERTDVAQPLFYLGGFVDDGYLYLYGNETRENDPNSPLSAVVRAPVLEAARRDSYRVWSADERDWVTDLSKRSAVLSRVPNALSVSFNRYLNGYLAVYSARSGDAIELHLAALPQGPFRMLGRVATEPSPFADLPTFYAQQHAALGDGCDERIVVSYTLPLARELTILGPIASASETRLLEIALE